MLLSAHNIQVRDTIVPVMCHCQPDATMLFLFSASEYQFICDKLF